MRHRKRKGKLSRTHSHREAMLANMACSLIEHEKINTTLPKAKVLRPYVEKIITLSKKGNLHARRLILSKIKQEAAVSRLFSVISERCKDRNGGYLRIVKRGFRFGDQAPMAVVELVDRSDSGDVSGNKSKNTKNDYSKNKVAQEA